MASYYVHNHFRGRTWLSTLRISEHREPFIFDRFERQIRHDIGVNVAGATTATRDATFVIDARTDPKVPNCAVPDPGSLSIDDNRTRLPFGDVYLSLDRVVGWRLWPLIRRGYVISVYADGVN